MKDAECLNSNNRRGGINPVSSVFLLIGNEKYLKEKAINELRTDLLNGPSGELDYKVLHGADTSADEILACVSTIPFFSSKRMIVVKDFENLPKEDSSRIAAYIRKPNNHTCLVLDAKEGALLKEDPSLGKFVRIMAFSNPRESELSSWIAKFISSKGKTIDKTAIEILKELKGGDLLSLSQELEKLITFTGSRKNITGPDVEKLTGKSIAASAFDISKAVAKKDTSRAIAIVYELVSAGKRPHEIIGLLAWHYRMLMKKDGRGSGNSGDWLKSKLEILLEADLGIKRARYNPSLILEFAIIRLCL